MGYLGTFYRTIGRRFSTILLTTTVAVFVFDYTFNKATDTFWDNYNKGKQWKDIKVALESAAAGGGEEEAAEE